MSTEINLGDLMFGGWGGAVTLVYTEIVHFKDATVAKTA